MKKLILLALVLFSAATMLAQTNRMSYQAVVRNAANELVAEENLTVAIRISDANSTSVFSETHSVTSNRNGVISLMIGEGSGQSGNMASVDWRTAQIHTEVTLPGGATLSNTTPVNAVPYAFYADSVDVQWVSDVVDEYLENHSISSIVETDPTVPDWAKEANKPAYDYSEIANTPQIPQIPADVSAFNNDAGYITAADIPAIPTVPTDVSAFNNDAGYITAAEVPAIPTVPTDVSAFNNDAHYITNTSTSCSDAVDLCELLEKLELLENQLEPIMILTQGVTAVTQNSFTVNGKVQSDGSAIVSQRGFVYASSNPNPTLSDSHVNSGGGNGIFTSTITGLTAGITYYVRAYATNQNGTFYGSEVAVTTTATSPSTVPSVTTTAVTTVGKFRATVSGSVTSDGGENVTQRGFVYGISSNPTTSNSVVTSGSGTGNFNILLNSLQAGTTYYVRAFAVNSKGTAYGNQLTFNTTADEQPAPVGNDGQPCTGTPTVTDHEGNVYNTVQIGTQCWTKENMRATTSPSTGTYLIPPTGTSNTYSGKQAYWYNNDSATYAPRNCGLQYNWNAAVDTFNTLYEETSVIPFDAYAVSITFGNHRRGICPQGWHVPSNSEWTELTNYLSSQVNYYYYDDESYDAPVWNSSYIAKALASTEGWNTDSHTWATGNNPSLNNATGFSAVSDNGNTTYFWSSTQGGNSGTAWNRYIYNIDARVFGDNNRKDNGLHVRCLRD